MKKLSLGLILVAIVGLALPTPASALYLWWDGQGGSGVDPLGHVWSAENDQDNGDGSWGMPGLYEGTIPWLASDWITDLHLTFEGLPTGVTVDPYPIPMLGSTDESTRFMNVSDNVLWDRFIGANTVSFVAASSSHRLDAGESFFVNVAFTGPISLDTFSFQAHYTQDVVPDAGTTLLLLGSALAGLGMLRRKLS